MVENKAALKNSPPPQILSVGKERAGMVLIRVAAKKMIRGVGSVRATR